MYYSAAHGGFYDPAIHGNKLPNDAKQITPQEYQQLLSAQSVGKAIIAGSNGLPTAIDPSSKIDALCQRIDTAADNARRAVAGDPMRAVEYDRTRLQAEQFAAAGYQGEVPPMVAAWVTSERDAQAAAEDILREAAQYENALVQVRTIRLQAKEQIRALMAAGDVDQAAQLTEQTIADLAACVQGVGNA